MNNKMRRCVLLMVLAAGCLFVCSPRAGLAWFGDAYRTPTGLSGGWATYTDCGTYWYTYGKTSSCSVYNRWAQFIPGFVWQGKGYISMDWVYVGAYGYLGQRLRYYNQANGLSGQYTEVNMCTHGCSWANVLGGVTGNLYDWNGIYIDCNESWDVGCGSPCGTRATSAREIRMWGDKWVYLNDWVVFGGYGNTSGNVSDTSNRSFPWGESGLYAYPAVDTSRGTYVRDTLYGSPRTPFRVQTGDCGQGNRLDFKGNAKNADNNNCDNCDAYAFAWVHTPGGAGPQLGVGADDGHRIWINGTLVSDNNAYTGGWDSYNAGAKSLATGWNRVLYKVHNGGGGFDGTMSLHNGGDWNQMEPSVSLQGDRYGGFSVGYEQDAWYPRIDVASFEGISNPQPDTDVYTNDTTINVSGTAWVESGHPVPLWTVLQYQWGYGISGNTNDAQVSSAGASWSHSQSGVTGHRRFHFFSVSRSGRLSTQTNGKTHVTTWADGGAGNYMDVFVDNVAPQTPSFSTVTAVGTTQINLGWAIPLDQGVNIAAGSTEDANAGGVYPTNTNHYRRGDVGVQVYRNGSGIYGWGAGTSVNDTGLSANTQYTYTIAARDNTGQGRGAWANSTGAQGSTARYTLQNTPSAPAFSSVSTTGFTVATTNPVNLTSGSSGVVFHDGTADRAKVTALSESVSGLTPNVQYTFKAKGVNGDGVATGYSATASKYTLATEPTADQNISCDKTTGTWMKGGTAITFTNPAGFGVSTHGGSLYKVSKFKYAWNNSSSHTFDGSEAEWSGSTLPQTPNVSGDYYLHLRSVNGDGAVTPTTFTMGPFKVDADAPAAGPTVSTTANSSGITINFEAGSDGQSGLAGLPYRVTRTTAYDSLDTASLSATDPAADLSAGGVGEYTITTKDAVGNTSQTTISGRVPLSGTAWIYTTGASSMAAPGLIPDKDSPATTGVFAGSNDYRLHGMDRVDGDMLFGPVGTVNTVLDRTAPIRDFAAYGLPNPMVFASSLDGNVYARRYESSAWSQAWTQKAVTAGYQVKVKPGGKLLISISNLPEGKTNPRNIVVVGTYDNSLNNSFVAMDMADGEVLWTTTPGTLATVTGSPVIYGNTAYFTSLSFDGSPSIWAVNLTTGAVIWSRSDAGSISSAPALSADGSVLYVGNDAGTVYAFSTANGTSPALWTNALGDGSVFGAPWPFGGTVFVSTSSKVHKLSASSGASEGSPWPVSVSLPSIPVVGASGKLYVGAQNGNIYEIVIATGATKTKSLGAAAGTIGDPVLGTDDGQLYVGAADGRIYKVATPF